MNARRILADLKLITNEPPPGVRLISQRSLTEWEMELEGPEQSAWENGAFGLTVTFPLDYSFKPQTVRFITPVYHPNINQQGGICLDLLMDKLVPSYHTGSFLVSIRSLLDNPNPDQGLNGDALELFPRKGRVPRAGPAVHRAVREKEVNHRRV
jgi:ubiquitin-protein ligase